MKKHLKYLMSGALIVIPLAATVAILIWVGSYVGKLGYNLFTHTPILQDNYKGPTWAVPIMGILTVCIVLYVIGLLANFWLFKKVFKLLDRLMSSLPGIKTIYESVRDLMKLFGSSSGQMGDVVIYTEPVTGVRKLGIVTNESPAGLKPDDDSVLVWLPMGYMIGGPIVFARPDHIEKIDMSVETALKLATTAFIGNQTASISNTNAQKEITTTTEVDVTITEVTTETKETQK